MVIKKLVGETQYANQIDETFGLSIRFFDLETLKFALDSLCDAYTLQRIPLIVGRFRSAKSENGSHNYGRYQYNPATKTSNITLTQDSGFSIGTLLHEFAHYVVQMRYGSAHRAHGWQFQQIHELLLMKYVKSGFPTITLEKLHAHEEANSVEITDPRLLAILEKLTSKAAARRSAR